MSVAVLRRICLTSAGDGSVPWVRKYAWITSAAAPATRGADSLVPPKFCRLDGAPDSLTQKPLLTTFGSTEQSAQFRSPGATRSIVRPSWAYPAEEIEEMLLSTYPPFHPGQLIPPNDSCAYERKVVDAPALMTSGSVAGEPCVFVTPASPVDATTVTPDATAASLANRVTSLLKSGKGLPLKDSLITFTP